MKSSTFGVNGAKKVEGHLGRKNRGRVQRPGIHSGPANGTFCMSLKCTEIQMLH
jgi:hypothetical protein